MQNIFHYAIYYCKRCFLVLRSGRSRRHIENKVLFGSYEVLSVLGTGATSTVYLARHLRLKTYRAVKCISKTRSMPSSIYAEADIIDHLRHPGIPILYDLQEDESCIYLVEEYIQGESLEDILLRKESISQEYVMQIGIQICSVLSFLHSRQPYPILYQDLKPSHIIVCGNQVKLIDFGFASLITSQGKKYHNFGTKGFAAPEQYGAGAMQVQSDLYQLGAIFRLYAQTHRGSCSGAFRHIIRKCTRTNARRRYSSAEQLREALQQALESTGQPESNLLRSISVVGASSGAGATHIAIALTSYLNQRGCGAVCVEHGDGSVYRAAARERRPQKALLLHEAGQMGSESQEAEVIAYRDFRCRLAEEEPPEAQLRETGCGGRLPEAPGKDRRQMTGIMIHDYGDDISSAILQEAECTVLVVNLSVWRREAAVKAYEQLRCMPGLAVVCNLSDRRDARILAARWNCRVYCYPYEVSPFGENKAREALFTHMLKEKGEEKGPWRE